MAVIGRTEVDGAGAAAVHVGLGRSVELLGFVEERDVGATTVQVVQLVSGEVNCLAIVTCGVVLGRRRLLARTWAGGVYSLHLPSCRPWRGIVRRVRHWHQGGESGKQGCRRGQKRRCSADGMTWARWIYRVWGSGRAPRLEPTPAQVPCLAALGRGKGVT